MVVILPLDKAMAAFSVAPRLTRNLPFGLSTEEVRMESDVVPLEAGPYEPPAVAPRVRRRRVAARSPSVAATRELGSSTFCRRSAGALGGTRAHEELSFAPEGK